MVAVVASYYVLFAVLDGSGGVLAIELAVMALFVASMIVGFRKSQWLIVAALAGHGVFDAFHSHVVMNQGVPQWWPAFCGTFDVAAAAILAVMLLVPRLRGQYAAGSARPA